MNIVLIGYRGTGKSVVGRLLSERLGCHLFSVDKMIVESVGMTIPEFVKARGWPEFRKIESEVVRNIALEETNSVIDCGGGVVLDDQNVVLLKQKGKMVLLKASLSIILKRIRKDSNRPPLVNGLSFEEEQKKVLEDRREKYLQAADLVCDTTYKRPHETVQEIIGCFKKNNWI